MPPTAPIFGRRWRTFSTRGWLPQKCSSFSDRAHEMDKGAGGFCRGAIRQPSGAFPSHIRSAGWTLWAGLRALPPWLRQVTIATTEWRDRILLALIVIAMGTLRPTLWSCSRRLRSAKRAAGLFFGGGRNNSAAAGVVGFGPNTGSGAMCMSTLVILLTLAGIVGVGLAGVGLIAMWVLPPHA